MTSPAPDSSWEAAAATLEATHRRPWQRRWRWWLWIVVLLVAITCLVPVAREADRIRHLGADPFFGWFYIDGADPDYLRQGLSETLSRDQQLVLFGDPARGRSGKWEALWRQFPERPDYYAQYASAHYSEHGSLPVDFLAIGEKIAPDNAWFPSFAAAVTSRRTVSEKPQSSAQIRARAPVEWDILNPARFDETMELLHKAAALPRFDDYGAALSREKQSLLPPPTDAVDRARNLMLTGSSDMRTISYDALFRAVVAKAWLLANQGDKEGFQLLLKDWIHLTPLQAESSDRLIEIVIMQGGMSTAFSGLKDSAERLGLTEEAARLKEASQQLKANNEARKNRSLSEEESDRISRHASLATRQSLPFILGLTADAPAPSISELEPGRRIDDTMVHRMLCLAVFPVVFLLCGASALYRFRSGHLLRRLSAPLGEALGAGDRAWIFAAALLPMIFWILLYACTPLGGRDWGYANPGIVTREVQLAAWLLLTIATPVVAARWRFRRRLPGLAVMKTGPCALGMLVVTGYIAQAVAGIYYLHPLTEVPAQVEIFEVTYKLPPGMVWPGIAALILLALLWWWLSELTRALFTSHDRALGRLVMTRLLVPAWIFLLLPASLLLPLSKARERYWIPRDTSLQPDKIYSGPESQVISRLKEQNLKVLRLVEPEH